MSGPSAVLVLWHTRPHRESMCGVQRLISRAEALTSLTAPGEPYELVDLVRPDRTLKVFKNAPATLRDLYLATATDAVFLVYENERYTFAETYRQSARLAHLLAHDYGVRKGDRVAISMRNFPEWVFAFMAATSIGAIAVAMNALWTPDEMEYGLTNSGSNVLVCDQERADRIAPRIEALGIRVLVARASHAPLGAITLGDALRTTDDVAMPPANIAPDDPAIIFYTSGSTGHPKGVLSTHRNIISALLSWELDGAASAREFGITPAPPTSQPATLIGIPLFHATGSHAVFLQSYRAQRKMVCMYKWDPEKAVELIEREQISNFTGPPAVTHDLVEAAKRTSRDLSSLRLVGGGGAARAPEQVRQIDRTLTSAMPATGWGMTETNAIGVFIAGPEYVERPASSGRCSAVMELKIVDDNGNALAANERGELLVRGTAMFVEYWNRPDLADSTFEPGGWFRTGDVAYLDDDGYLFIVDRVKDLIIRGGENIGCGGVEAALLMHPRVREAAVYAVPEERLGEEVGATIYTDGDIDLDELRTFLGAHLAKFEIPQHFVIATEPLPRTASGKILKRQLQREALDRPR
ncbi:MAG: hypothetical protein RL219_2064 [Actinomycetota bacterium]